MHGESLEQLTLLDWKRRVFALYAEVRALAADDPERAWQHWRDVRAELYGSHPQSPRVGAQPQYFPYDRRYRWEAHVEPLPPQPVGIGEFEFVRFGLALFADQRLELYWLAAYGGGIFLPFRDGTSGVETYGAGRYLLDTVKGADLGGGDRTLVLDFNFAYSPSCAWDAEWACPLSPPANRLAFRVEAGELAP